MFRKSTLLTSLVAGLFLLSLCQPVFAKKGSKGRSGGRARASRGHSGHSGGRARSSHRRSSRSSGGARSNHGNSDRSSGRARMNRERSGDNRRHREHSASKHAARNRSHAQTQKHHSPPHHERTEVRRRHFESGNRHVGNRSAHKGFDREKRFDRAREDFEHRGHNVARRGKRAGHSGGKHKESRGKLSGNHHDRHHGHRRHGFSLFLGSYGYGFGYPSYYDPGYFDDGYAYSYGPEEPAVVVDVPVDDAIAEEPPLLGPAETEAGLRYLASARQAFLEADYKTALQQANHAAVEMPGNPEVHQFAALALFAVGDYRAAASAAQVALSMGNPWDWPAIRGHYTGADVYTAQLRALEGYRREKPAAAYAAFLLGYHYLMSGYPEAADKQLASAVELNPKDKLATSMLNKLRGIEPPVVAPKP